MKVSIKSFSFKRSLPEDATGNGNAPGAEGDQVGRMSEANEPRSGRKSPRGFVFDCRAMPNPFWDEELRGYAGLDKPICDFFDKFKDKVDCFLDAAESLVRQSIDEYLKDGRDHFAVRFANATSPSRGTLALRAEPGPPTARVTLFALDEANLPK